MNKASTHSIYNCLEPAFWTKRKCLNCQKFFTSTDYQTKNYQLFFKEIGNIKSAPSLNYAVLEGVMVELQHQQCSWMGGNSIDIGLLVRP